MLPKALEKSMARRPAFAFFPLHQVHGVDHLMSRIMSILIFWKSKLLSTNDLVKDRYNSRGQYPGAYFVDNSKYADVSLVFKALLNFW